MQHLFLTASIDTANVAQNVLNKLKLNSPHTAFVVTPVEAEAKLGLKTWEGEERHAMQKAGFHTFDYTITGKTLSQFKQDLENIDVLYVSGGNEQYFREVCDDTGFEKFVKEFVASGRPYVGTSCGSIIAGHSMLPTSKLNDLSLLKRPINPSGFGLVNFSVLPHWGLEDFRQGYIVDSFENMYHEPFPLIAINNYQYIEVTGNNYKIIDVRNES